MSQFCGIKYTIGMRDKSPGDFVNAGVSSQRTLSQFRQHAIVAWWQIVLDLADLLVNDMDIVEQPFSCRRNRLGGSRGFGNYTVTGNQHGRIVEEPGNQLFWGAGYDRNQLL